MLTYRVFVRVLIFVGLEFTIRCRCVELQKKCYRVDDLDVCFFRPEAEYKWITWQEAWQICRRSNATLPTIPNEETQQAFEKYMSLPKLVDRDDLWMSGQEIRGREWKWLNGMTANTKDYSPQVPVEDLSVQGVLTNNMLYSRDYPGNRNNYVCQFSGAACQSNKSIPLSNGCLILDSNDTLNAYDARNRCVRRGGDLAVIDSRDDLYRFREVVTRIRNLSKVWIGLRRQWWIWKATDSTAEMTYSNWLPNHGFNANHGCMVVNMNGYKWQEESCNSSKLFACQRVEVPSEDDIALKLPYISSITTITVSVAAGISFLVVAVIVAALIIRKARQRRSDVKCVPTQRSYQELQDSLTSNHQYAQLRVTQQQFELNPDYQNMSDYVEPLRNSRYLEIID